MKLYVSIHNWTECHTSWLGACSTDQEKVKTYLEHWFNIESACGNGAEGFVQEVNVCEKLIWSAQEATRLGLRVKFPFDTEVDALYDEDITEEQREQGQISYEYIKKIIRFNDTKDCYCRALFIE